MGLGGKGKDVLHQRTGLTRVDVADVARGILAKVGDSTRGRPVIDVDCNNFIHVNSRNASDPVAHTANALKEWSRLGLEISPICDGKSRPKSKQQSHENEAKREKSRVDAVLARQELRELSRKIQRGEGDGGECDLLEQKRLERKIKTAEPRLSRTKGEESIRFELKEGFWPTCGHSAVFFVLCSCWARHECCWLLPVAVKEHGIQVGDRASKVPTC